jgi:hypothetical protein
MCLYDHSTSMYEQPEWYTRNNVFSLHTVNRKVEKTKATYILKEDPSKQSPHSTISLP